MEPQQNMVHEPAQQTAHKEKGSAGKKFGLALMVLIFLAVAGFGGWWYRDMTAKEAIASKDKEIAAANQNAENLAAQLGEAEAGEQTSLPGQEAINNIEAAIRSKNYAATQDYMAAKVNVIIAASEGLGMRTQTQAIEDLKYLDDATDPWDFNLDEATLTSFQDGSYAQYFTEGSLFGQSDDGKVVAISFNGQGKIVGVFLSASSDILQ